jgi:hypothetical protein
VRVKVIGEGDAGEAALHSVCADVVHLGLRIEGERRVQVLIVKAHRSSPATVAGAPQCGVRDRTTF